MPTFPVILRFFSKNPIISCWVRRSALEVLRICWQSSYGFITGPQSTNTLGLRRIESTAKILYGGWHSAFNHALRLRSGWQAPPALSFWASFAKNLIIEDQILHFVQDDKSWDRHVAFAPRDDSIGTLWMIYVNLSAARLLRARFFFVILNFFWEESNQ